MLALMAAIIAGIQYRNYWRYFHIPHESPKESMLLSKKKKTNQSSLGTDVLQHVNDLNYAH